MVRIAPVPVSEQPLRPCITRGVLAWIFGRQMMALGIITNERQFYKRSRRQATPRRTIAFAPQPILNQGLIASTNGETTGKLMPSQSAGPLWQVRSKYPPFCQLVADEARIMIEYPFAALSSRPSLRIATVLLAV